MRFCCALLVEDEDAIGGEVGFVDGDPTGVEEVTDRGRQGHLGEGNRLIVGGTGKVEEGGGLIVVEDELSAVVDEDEALTERMERGVVEREEPFELLGPVAEGDTAEVAAEDPRAEPAEGDGDGGDDEDLRRAAAWVSEIVSRVTPTATIAVTPPASSTMGTIARTEGPSVPTYSSVSARPVRAVSILPM